MVFVRKLAQIQLSLCLEQELCVCLYARALSWNGLLKEQKLAWEWSYKVKSIQMWARALRALSERSVWRKKRGKQEEDEEEKEEAEKVLAANKIGLGAALIVLASANKKNDHHHLH